VARMEENCFLLLAFQYHLSGYCDLAKVKQRWWTMSIFKIKRNKAKWTYTITVHDAEMKVKLSLCMLRFMGE